MGKREDDLKPKSTLMKLNLTSTQSKILLQKEPSKENQFSVNQVKLTGKNDYIGTKQNSVTPSLFMNGLGTFHKANVGIEHIKPSLFNKDLSSGNNDTLNGKSIKPSLFSLKVLDIKPHHVPKVKNCELSRNDTVSGHNIKPSLFSLKVQDNAPKQNGLKPHYITREKKESLISKQQTLHNKKLKTKTNESAKAGKSCNLKKTTHSKSKKKNNAELAMITTANVNDLVVADDYFKKKQLAMIRKKLKMENKQLFMDDKMLNQNAIKFKKDKVLKLKQQLINMVSVSLFHAPDIGNVHDQVRISLMKQMKELSQYDPEFILKLALYTRKVLNVRVVSTFMLAFAAYLTECRPYIKKYLKATVVLPSDWIGVAELYQTFFDDSISFGALPTALRKAMVEKFQDFDEYQLAKYNKGAKTQTKNVTFIPSEYDFLRSESKDLDEDGDDYREYDLKSLSLKQLVRKLHISQPAYHIMCLVGKKYPSSIQEFYQSHLPGNFQEELAGKRMKLKTPETWETQVSMKGNKATTWQDLLDHKKLPFMAMMRNLRNMISAGMRDKYHNMIIHRLTDEKSVINSKQFPFRFLAAYDIIELMEQTLETGVDVASANYSKKKKEKEKPILYNQSLLTRYKKALEKALKIATIHNISPIPGVTFIIVDVTESLSETVLTKSISPAKRTCLDVSLLLAVMCYFHCEESVLIVNDAARGCFATVENLKDTKNILQMVHEIRNVVKKLWGGEIPQDGYGCDNLTEYMCQYIGDRKMIDNMYLISYSGIPFLNPFISLYRKEVNPAVLIIRQNIDGSHVDSSLDGDYDVTVSGYSDQILKYLGERGAGRQLTAVENVDKTFNLKDVQIQQAKKEPADVTQVKVQRPLLTWRTIRVFISSTFRDMHGERDLLTKYVFPELRRWCYNYCLNLYEVDLRWGITEKQAQSEKQLELCLSEVMKADLFVGILGERFGWVPSNYDVDNKLGLEWLDGMPKGCSMTELEMRGFLNNRKKNKKALFLFRDPEFLRDVPQKLKDDFITKDGEAIQRMTDLKKFITELNGVRVVENYPCTFGGLADDVPYTADLDEFGKAVLANVWSVIKENYIESQDDETEVSSTDSEKHQTFVKEINNKFIGRKTLLEKVMETLKVPVSTLEHGGPSKNIVVVSGKSGSGKTAFMARLSQFYTEESGGQGVYYFSETGPEYQQVGPMIRHLFNTLKNEFNEDTANPENERELKVQFENLLKSISKRLRRWQKFCIFIDGLETMDKGRYANLLDWIPDVIPKGIFFVISCLDNTPISKILANHRQLISIIKIPAFEHSDRASFVRNTLQQYGKELDESPFNNQMRILLSKKGAESPLYLKLACEELRLFGVYEKLSDYLKSMAQNIPQLIEFVLKRIESTYGKNIVGNIFLLLRFSRQGLTEDELYEALNLLKKVKTWQDVNLYDSRCLFNKDRFVQFVPRATFACLCREMKVFLNEDIHTGTITLIHRDIINLIQQHYVADNKTSSLIHFVLACLFRKQVDPNNDLKWHGKDVKALTELPYHMASSGLLWDDLRKMLTSVYFIKAKVERGHCLQLLEDLQLNLPLLMLNNKWLAKQKQFLANDDVKDITKFIAKNLDVLGNYPKLLLQQAVNAPDGSYMQLATSRIPSEDIASLIHWLNKPTESSSCSLTISTIKSPIQCISLSRDGSHVACGTLNGDVFIYDKETSKEVNSFVGHTGAITACCYAGNKLCSASTDASISVWDLETGHRLHIMKSHKEPITGCTATQDGKLLISVSLDKSARLWNLTDGKEAGQFTGSDCPLNCVALDCEEKHAAIGGWNKMVVIWNILENKKVATYKGHKSSVRALAYSPNGRHLASSGLDGELLLWSVQNGAMIGQVSQLSHYIHHVSFSADGTRLLGASSDTSIKVWSGTLGCPEQVLDQPRDKEHPEAVINDYALSVAVCDAHVAVGYNTGRVCIFDNTDERRLLMSWKAHASSVRTICFLNRDSSKKDLITASDDSKIIRWRFKTDTEPEIIRKYNGHSDGVTCVRSREAFIITSSRDCSVRVWNAILFDDSEIETKDVATLHGHTGIVTSCDLSPCETKAISCGYDRTMYIWDLNNFSSLCVIHNAHADGVTTCCWSDVGTYVVTGSNDFKLKLWNTKVMIQNADNPEKLTERSVFTGHTATINEVKYKFGCVVSTSTDGKVKVWTQNGIEITTFQPHNTRINSCDLWAPGLDGDQDENNVWAERGSDLTSIQQRVRAKTPKNLKDIELFTASDDGKVSCWRPFKPDLLETMYGHSSNVCQVIEGKSNEIISCSLDETIKVWDSMTTKQSNLLSHSGEVSCIVIHQDGEFVATGGRDGFVHLYQQLQCIGSYQTKDKSPVTALEFADEFAKQILCGTSSGAFEICFSNQQQHQHEVMTGSTIFVKKHCPIVAIKALPRLILVSFSTSVHIFKKSSAGKTITEIPQTKDSSRDPWIEKYYGENTIKTKYHNAIVNIRTCGSRLFFTETHQRLCFESLDDLRSKMLNKQCSKRYLHEDTNSYTLEDETMIHSICPYGNKVVIGHSNGHVTFLANQNDEEINGEIENDNDVNYEVEKKSVTKIHNDAVTGIFIHDDIMVTSSYDATIKVWQLSNLQQIGLFTCRSSVVSMEGFYSKGSINLYAGDRIGNVEFLKLTF